MQCVLSRWNFSHTTWGNPFGACVADIMHVLDSGMALHLLENNIAVLSKPGRRDVERRKKTTKGETPNVLLRLPGGSSYFLSGANYAAFEHRSMMQAYPDHASHWRFPKIHMIVHLLDNAIMRGMPHHYSTEMWEHTHKGTIKIPVRGSNWKDIPRRIVEEEVQREICREVAQDAGGGRQYATALRESWYTVACPPRQAVETMKPVLTRKGRTMRPEVEGDAVMATYRTALGDLMDSLPGCMVAANITASEIVVRDVQPGATACVGGPRCRVMRGTVAFCRTLLIKREPSSSLAPLLQAHTAVAIPRTKGGALVSKGAFIKASPKEKWFTDIAVKSNKKKEEWYAKALCIFKAATADGERRGFVYMRWYEQLFTEFVDEFNGEMHAQNDKAVVLVHNPKHVLIGCVKRTSVVEGFVVEELTRVRVVQTLGVVPACAFSAFTGVVDTLKAVFRTWFLRGAVESPEWINKGVFQRPPLYDVLYKLFMAGRLTMPGSIQRSWWRAGCVPNGWMGRMDRLKGRAAAALFDCMVVELTTLQLVIEEFKSKCSSGLYMTAWDFVGCDEDLIEKWKPAGGEDTDSEEEIPAYFCIPEGPLMRDSRSCRRVVRMVHGGFVKQAEVLGIHPRDVPEEVGVVNEEVVSRLRRTPPKRTRAGSTSDEGITSDGSEVEP
ncbi:unnamed protein product [Closterium sp. Naga37s-1]|nr:unnamed protein product [Closterium sp. Naga37s-1]